MLLSSFGTFANTPTCKDAAIDEILKIQTKKAKYYNVNKLNMLKDIYKGSERCSNYFEEIAKVLKMQRRELITVIRKMDKMQLSVALFEIIESNKIKKDQLLGIALGNVADQILSNKLDTK
jgi:hypothetical protein